MIWDALYIQSYSPSMILQWGSEMHYYMIYYLKCTYRSWESWKFILFFDLQLRLNAKKLKKEERELSHGTMQYNVQCVPRNMTFIKSLFLVKTSFCYIIFFFEINFNITWLPYNIFIDLWYSKQLNKLCKKTF